MNKRRLNVAILAIAAALAVSAVASAAASAGTFKAESYPATITGEQTTSVLFTGVVGKWSCKKVTMQGSMSSSSSALNLAPVYTECAWAGVAATTFMEGCTYEFTAGETVEGSENKIQATMDIKCPAGKEVKLVLNGGTCTIWIPEQASLGSATFENTPAATPDDVDLTLNLSGIKYRVETGVRGCPVGTNGTYTNGSITGGVKLKAVNGIGTPINWSIS
jgi:hypothetical protein